MDLLLGGLTSELAAILTEAAVPALQAATAGCASSSSSSSSSTTGSSSSSSGSGCSNTARGQSYGPDAVAAAAAAGPVGCLPQPVLDFYTSVLPLPKLALLVFTEVVAVDPGPSCMAIPGSAAPAATQGCAAAAVSSNSNSGGGSGAGVVAGSGTNRLSNLRDRPTSHNQEGSNGVSSRQVGMQRNGSGERRHAGGGSSSNRGYNKDSSRTDKEVAGTTCDDRSDRPAHHSSTVGSQDRPVAGSRGTSRGGSSSGNSSSDGYNKKTSKRACEFDLEAEAAALEAAATAAAPLIAAAVCDLPTTGRKQRNSNTSDN